MFLDDESYSLYFGYFTEIKLRKKKISTNQTHHHTLISGIYFTKCG